jgi:AcrR family transcriptional regulator
MNRTNGRIAEESKKRFAEGLLELMKTYPYPDITVTQLSQEAELSRKTFYRLFNDKDDVLKLLFDGLYYECFTQIKGQNIRRYWDLVQLYFDFWESRKEILLLLSRNGLLPRLFEYVYRNAQPIFTAVRTEETTQSFAPTLPYLLAYSVGGMHSMLMKWAESGMTTPSTALIQQLKVGFQSPNL